jgi:anaerobic magnesium-protoporphyrin IX monomethyl ester cyclase
VKSGVLLVYPPTQDWNITGFAAGRLARLMCVGPPLGLLFLSSTLRADGRAVDVVHGEYEPADPRNLLRRAKAIDAPTIGFYTTAATEEIVVGLLRGLRSSGSTARLLCGGPGALNPAPFLEAGADFVLHGEGEIVLPRLLDALDADEPVAGLPGLVWRENGAVVRGASPQIIEDLDALPYPDWEIGARHKYYMRYYFLNREPYYVMVCSRGGPNRCGYCTTPVARGGRVVRRSIPNVMGEVELLVRRFGARTIDFYDDDFLGDEAWVLDLCDAISRSGLRFGWVCYVSPREWSPQVVAAMARSGCHTIKIGLQSAAPAVLRTAGRHERTIDQTARMLRQAKDAGMIAVLDLITGLPGETDETVEATAQFARRADPTIAKVTSYRQIPQTRLAREYPELGRYESPEQIAWRSRIVRAFFARPQPWLRFLRFLARRPALLLHGFYFAWIVLLAVLQRRQSEPLPEHGSR